MEFGSISESESEQSKDLSALSDDFDTESDTEINATSGFEPYKFEPLVSDEEASGNVADDGNKEKDKENESRRLHSSDWCSCGNCVLMSTVQECTCCMEIDVVQHKCEEDGLDLNCIVQHPGFEPVCLNPFVLDTAYLQYRQQYGDTEEAGPGRNRYTAYRQFARWCWGYLGKKVRVVLPSCVVNKIRETFPSQVYTGFKENKN